MNITGEVQNIKSNRKSLQIDNNWYNSFNLLPEEINKGDYIEIVYVTKKVDNKEFNNIRSINKIESKNMDKEDKSDNEKSELTSTDKNCLIIKAVDLHINNPDYSIEYYLKEIKRLRLSI